MSFMIDLPCPECGQKLRFADELAGQPVSCPFCRAMLALPAPTETNPLSEIPQTIPQSPGIDQGGLQRSLRALTPRVYVTPALVGINIAVFGIMMMSGVDFFSPKAVDVLKWGANFGPQTTNGQWWRLLTACFLHFGVLHLGLNMWALWDAGNLVERMVGNVGFLLLYIISGLVGSISSLIWYGANPVVSAGASGAVFGVWGALTAVALRQRDAVHMDSLAQVRNSGMSFVGYNLVFGLFIPNIDMGAHVGGLVAGFICGLVLSQPLVLESKARRPLRNLAVAILGTAAVALGILMVPRDDFVSAVIHVSQVEEQATSTYDRASKQARAGTITPAQFADIMDKEVLPPWREARKRWNSIARVPPDQYRLWVLYREYMEMREQAWDLIAEGARTGDDQKTQLGIFKEKAADAIAEKFSAESKEKRP